MNHLYILDVNLLECVCVCVCVYACVGVGVLVAQSCPTLWTPWTVAHQAPLSKEFSRQE